MKKLIVIVGLALSLTACASKSELIKTKYHVLVPPEEMFNCPIIKQFPDPDKLSDPEVAKTLVTLYKNNRVCKNSVAALQKFLQSAKEKIEADPDK